MVRDDEQHYAIAQTNLVELVRLEREGVKAGIEYVHSIPVHRLRGRLLELIELGRTFGRHTVPLPARQCVDIVVLKVDGREFGLVVDETEDTQDVGVKPPGGHFSSVPAFAGATIRGDGGVALILDVRALGQLAGALSDSASSAGGADAAAAADESDVTTLIVRVGETRMALPLGAVVRLEEFPAESIEVIRGHLTVQYRGELLPLVDGGQLDVGGPSAFAMAWPPPWSTSTPCRSPTSPHASDGSRSGRRSHRSLGFSQSRPHPPPSS